MHAKEGHITEKKQQRIDSVRNSASAHIPVNMVLIKIDLKHDDGR